MARSPQPRTPQSFSRVLAADSKLAAWEARRRREEALTVLVRRHLPRPLAERVRVVNAESAELELAVEAGAVGAIVRQRAPDLLAALRHGNWQFTGIRVRVQVREAPAPEPKLARNQPDRESLQPLAGFARTLPPGALKSALGRLLRRIG